TAQEGHSGGLSIKDELAHLWAWQQITNARLAAALSGQEPRFPDWVGDIHPDTDDHLDRLNNRIYEASRDKPWRTVYDDWREGLRRVLQQSGALLDSDLLTRGRYPWLGDHPLIAVLHGTFNHHREHLEELQERLGREAES